QLGFRKGVNIVSDMGGNVLQKLTEGASILGLFVMGVLVTKWTSINVPLVVFTNACRRWLHRHHDRAEHSRPTLPWFAGARSDAAYGSSTQQKINPVWLIFALFGLGIIGNALGFLS
ncbi:sorbose permease IID component domain protein, partial [Escherichia coli OK1357]